jgi:drug/metabolite transporter (DMT)-like permease
LASAIAILSSAVGGGAAVATRYLITSADPFTLAALRFGGGVVCLLPIALLLRVRWPVGQPDRLLVAGLGFLFFAVFFVFYNLALAFTTVARGTLALSTLPLMTMLEPSEWAAALYLAAGGGALAFFLWVLALQHASPTRVANTMTVNPIVAGLLAAGLLGEPLTLNLAIGLIAVFAGVWIATTEGAASQ